MMYKQYIYYIRGSDIVTPVHYFSAPVNSTEVTVIFHSLSYTCRLLFGDLEQPYVFGIQVHVCRYTL